MVIHDFEQVIAGIEDEQQAIQEFHGALDQEYDCPDHSIPHCSPFPIFISQQQRLELSELCDALSTAISNIVDRWWSDQEPRLWQMIPLPPKAAALLRWLDEDSQRAIRPYSQHLGFWRPDILLEKIEGGAPQIKICEINARYMCNGFLVQAHCNEALRQTILKSHSECKVEDYDAAPLYRDTFDASQPLFIVRGATYALDIDRMANYLTKNGICQVVEVALKDLVASPGHKLSYCRSSAVLEVTQALVELSQVELLSASLNILKALALVSWNDMRTIFLAHDKRMLGVVRQQLPAMGAQQTLSPPHVDLLRSAIVPTYLPSSCEMADLMESFSTGKQQQKDWILKPVGGGKGHGILLGKDFACKDAWLAKLHEIHATLPINEHVLESRLCVLQPYIRQPRFDLVVVQAGLSLETKSSQQLVGTMLMAAGHYVGMGPWRASSDHMCAISRGGVWFGGAVGKV